MPHRHVSEPAPAARRPVVEVAAPGEPTGLDAGHTLEPPGEVVQPEQRQQRGSSADLLALLLNSAAALVASAAAFAAAGRRSRTNPIAGAQILHLPTPSLERRRAA